jgi:LDH2 family malate/lactate/ureidoglycolate dehydrogenase
VEAAVTTRVKPDQLRDFCAGLFEGAGVPSADARTVADSLVEADLRGVSSHGTTRVGIYLERLQAGLINSRPTVAVIRETATTLLLDGDNGLGPVVGVRAMDEAIRRATEYGTAWVGVRNSNHFGAAAYYVTRAITARCIGFALTNAPATMALWGGRTPFLGTNPFAMGVPAGRERPIVVDMATSVAARGKIILAAKKGEAIPSGLAVDVEGRPTTDAQAALDGAVLPFAQHKGYGIALLIEMLSGVLAGATIAPAVGNLYGNPTGTQNLGHGFGALRVEALAPIGEFAERMDTLIREVRQSPRGAGIERIYLPGEIEFELAERNRRDGLALAEPTVRELSALGTQVGVACPF